MKFIEPTSLPKATRRPITTRASSVVAIALPMMLCACASGSYWLPSAGPAATQVVTQDARHAQVAVIDVNDAVTERLLAAQRVDSFSASLASPSAIAHTLGPGDVLEISLWEAPPATLFGTTGSDPRSTLSGSRQVTLPQQIIHADGMINIPFGGAILVAGKTAQQIEQDIRQRLTGKANQPQVLVRVVHNATRNVTVVGEVTQSLRMPLTAKGERMLDAIAAAGGVRQPVNKMTVQLSRKGNVLAMPLERVVREPQENVLLQPGDVLTLLFQPSSFTALGAIGKNEEISFEAHGISLAQALGRIAGLRDNQADARGIFIFRFEEATVAAAQPQASTSERIPVVYRIDLSDPRAFLLAQHFPLKNQDVLYVANAPAAELQKFLGIVTSSLFSVSNLLNLR